MKLFMDADFLLDTKPASALYHGFAEKMPIIDYHCHINPADIAQNRHYQNITEVWLGGDHYKWRAMRGNGVAESHITGAIANDPYRVFLELAATLPKLVGNPLYHWTYLELRRYFSIEEPLNPVNARRIYNRCNEMLQHDDLSVRGIILRSGVKLICTTDDPLDSLEYHRQIAADTTFPVRVLPAFRPDKAFNIDKPGFQDYIAKLATIAGFPIRRFADLQQALVERIDYFAANGCKISDHGLDQCVFEQTDEAQLDLILNQALAGSPVSAKQADAFKTAVLLLLARRYSELDWVMQIHLGAARNNSFKWFKKLGPDTGFDSVGDIGPPTLLAQQLNAMESGGFLPKMILYSLNQQDNETLASIAGCFQTDGVCPSRIQLGSAWWFNDNKIGITKQLTDYANIGILGNFVGMTTDSRSFLSYTRHEYFRRILCNLLGTWMENGELNESMEDLGRLVQDVCANNAIRYFGFPSMLLT